MNPDSPRKCGECGRPLGEGAAFCRTCGAKYREPTGGEASPDTNEALPQVEPVPPAERAAKPPRPGPAPRQPVVGPEAAKPGQSPPPAEPLPPVAGRSRRLAPLAIGAAVLVAVGAVVGAILIERGGSSDEGGGESAEPAASRSAEAQSEAGASGLPPVDRTQMTREIRTLLLAFHEDVVDGEFQAAWALLSPRKRRQDLAEPGGYRAWRSAQASLSSYLSPGGLKVQIESLEGDGVARVMLTGMGWSQPGSPCSEWSGLTWVKYQGGEWTYDPGYSTTLSRRRAWQPRSGELLGIGC